VFVAYGYLNIELDYDEKVWVAIGCFAWSFVV